MKWDSGETKNWKIDQIELKIRFLMKDERYKNHRTKVDHQAWNIMPQSWIRRKEVGERKWKIEVWKRWKEMEIRKRIFLKKENAPK